MRDESTSANRRALRERAYAMKKHHATRLHYDLRLEWNGVLLSWALPEGPSCCAGVIRKAIEMEDHSDLPPISHPLITGVSRFSFCFEIISQPS